MSKSYETGYRKPPKSKRFKKGESGNPAGRPKKKETTHIEEIAELYTASVKISENGQVREVPAFIAVLKQHMVKALGGNPQSTKLVFYIYENYIMPHLTKLEAQRLKDSQPKRELKNEAEALAYYTNLMKKINEQD